MVADVNVIDDLTCVLGGGLCSLIAFLAQICELKHCAWCLCAV